MDSMIKVPKEDGAWWMALTCWICGWGASLAITWEPLVVGSAFVSLMFMAQTLRSCRRLWRIEPGRAGRLLAMACMGVLLPIATFSLLIVRTNDLPWTLAATVPSILYGIVLVLGKERRPWARLLGVVSLTSISAVTYACAVGRFDTISTILWSALGLYFLLGSILVMARFRRSRGALLFVRVSSLAVVAGTIVCSFHGLLHWVIGGGFLLLGARSFLVDTETRPADPKKLGNRELAYASISAALVLAGIWMIR
ncbi:MAG: hypothetical protein CMQ20_00485 [Gammaproteobacteria bacterium]|nr:hypothetical protein [Gammaproteobacteria bacterium]